MRVLLYQCETDFCATLAEWVAQKTQLIVVKSAAKLHEKLSEASFDLVILNAYHEKQSGYAIAEEIKSSYPSPPTLVLISNESSIGEREKAKYAGVDHLLIVPFAPQELGVLL